MYRRSMAMVLVLMMVLTLLPMSFPSTAGPGSRSTMFSDDFESGVGDWTHDGAQDEWELGDPSDGPGYCHSDDNCWATDLNDTYESEANAYLRSPTINLSGYETAFLEYWQWYDLVDFLGFFSDRGFVEISNDGGQSFDLKSNFTGSSAELDWHKITINLEEYLGDEIIVRFRLSSDEIFEDSGWFIDDFAIKVNEEPPPDKVHDLAVIEVHAMPMSPDVGQKVDITVVIENQGDFTEKGATVTLSIKHVDSGKVVFEETKDVDAVDPDKIAKVNFAWGGGRAGQYIMTAKLSLSTDEEPDNNVKVERLRVGPTHPHDLAIIEFYVVPNSPVVKSKAIIVVVVKNLGEYEEKDIPLDLKVSDPEGKIVFKVLEAIDHLEVGEIITFEFEWTPSEIDTYDIRAHLEMKPDATPENNKKKIVITVVSAGGIDMEVSWIGVEPDGTGPGVARKITVRIKNVGSKEALNVKLHYELNDPSGLISNGTASYDLIEVGDPRESTWEFTPLKDGLHTVKAWVVTEGDIEGDNDMRTLVFTVPKIYPDVGVESLSVVPRTAGLGLRRTVQAEVANYGDSKEGFVTVMTITDPGDRVVATRNEDVTLVPGQKVTVSLEYDPVVIGVHNVTVYTVLTTDTEPANDHAETFFLVTDYEFHDLGIEGLSVDPRSAGLVDRVFNVTVANLGTEMEKLGSVDFSIWNGTSDKVMGSTYDLPDLAPDEDHSFNMNFTPAGPGNYTAKVEVLFPDDDFEDNDVMETTFWALSPVAHDMGIELLEVVPRTGDLEERDISVHIRNTGLSNETQFHLTINVTWSSNATVLFDDDVTGDFLIDGVWNQTFQWTPPGYGTYKVMAYLSMVNDSFSGNDEAMTDLFAKDKANHDLGIGDLKIEPRTDLVEVRRLITATITNNGDKDEVGHVAIVVRDQTGKEVHNESTDMNYTVSGYAIFQTTFTPQQVCEYEVEASITILGGITDFEPTNDIITMTLIAKERPPDIDIAVEGLFISPVLGETGKDVDITAMVMNHGLIEAKGTVFINVTDPGGERTVWKEDMLLRPGGYLELQRTLNPVKAGVHDVTVQANFKGDEDRTNDVMVSSFNVVIGGGRDAAIIALDVDRKGGCSLSFEVKATVHNNGTLALGDVRVELEVTGGGDTYYDNATIYLARDIDEVVSFNFTAPGPGSYNFIIRVKANGDEDPSNDVMNKYATACDPEDGNRNTTVDEIPMTPFIILILIIVAVTVIIYRNMMTEKGRTRAMEEAYGRPERKGGRAGKGGRSKQR